MQPPTITCRQCVVGNEVILQLVSRFSNQIHYWRNAEKNGLGLMLKKGNNAFVEYHLILFVPFSPLPLIPYFIAIE